MIEERTVFDDLLEENGIGAAMNEKINNSKTFEERIVNTEKKATVAAYLMKEKAMNLYKKAQRIDRKTKKDEEDDEVIRQLRDEATRINQEAMRLSTLSSSLRLGEKILFGFFGAHVLIAAMKDLKESPYYYGMNKPVQDLLLAGKEVSPMEARAIAIEHVIECFQRISDKAIEQKLMTPGNVLLTPEDKGRLQNLADLMRNTKTTPEQYASVCKELGLNYNDAKRFFEREKSLAMHQSITANKEKILSCPNIYRRAREVRNLESGCGVIGIPSKTKDTPELDAATPIFKRHSGIPNLDKPYISPEEKAELIKAIQIKEATGIEPPSLMDYNL